MPFEWNESRNSTRAVVGSCAAVVAALLSLGCAREVTPGPAESPDDRDRPRDDAAHDGTKTPPGVPPSPCTGVPGFVPVESPDALVGDGNAASCTEAALQAALDRGGSIAFACGNAPHTIVVTRPLVLRKSAVIDGGGQITLSGGGRAQVLVLEGQTDVTLLRFTIEDAKTDAQGAAIERKYGAGKARLALLDMIFRRNVSTAPSSGGAGAGGGAIHNHESELVIARCRFEQNEAANGGAIHNLLSTMTIYESLFAANRAVGTSGGDPGAGGAIESDTTNASQYTVAICGSRFEKNAATFQGGGLFLFGAGRSRVEFSTIANNTSTRGDGAAFGGGLLAGQGEHTIFATAVIGNRARDQGGGIYVIDGGRVSVTSSTVAKNRTDVGGGGGIFLVSGSVALDGATIAENHAGGDGGGIFADRRASARATLFVRNTADNGGQKYGIFQNCGYAAPAIDKPPAALVDLGGNLQFETTPGSTFHNPDCTDAIRTADPKLAPLGDNGGPTWTMALGEGSPAIDLGPPGACPPADQRGRPRTGRCDVGAYEAP
jgi:hypothetical protein